MRISHGWIDRLLVVAFVCLVSIGILTHITSKLNLGTATAPQRSLEAAG